jgi:CBS domain containing-hemolysin-like protein
LIKNADKVSSFCCDVVGDICGIISGSTGATIALALSQKFHLNSLLIMIIVMSLISALTIGGKAFEKSIAINKSEDIVKKVADFLSIFIKNN